MTLKELELGSTAQVTAVGGEGALRQHFLDMGVIPGAEVTLVKYAPMGDPMELRVHGYELTLRLADAEKIEIIPIAGEKGADSRKNKDRSLEKMEESGLKTISKGDTGKRRTDKYKQNREHPGFGEGGRYHVKADENPLPNAALSP